MLLDRHCSPNMPYAIAFYYGVSYSIAAIAASDLRSRLTFLRFHIHCEISAETEETTNHWTNDTRYKLLFVIYEVRQSSVQHPAYNATSQNKMAELR
jgi:hypothetical protein